MTPWKTATVAPPSVRPNMMVKRETGATKVSFRNPNCLSQIISMPEKIAVKRMRHRDDARREELHVVTAARLGVHGSEPEPERDEEEHRLSERPDDAGAAACVTS